MTSVPHPEIEAYYKAKEPYTKLLFNGASRKPSEADAKKPVNSTHGQDSLGSLFADARSKNTESLPTKSEFEALFKGDVAAREEAATTAQQDASVNKKALPIRSKIVKK